MHRNAVIYLNENVDVCVVVILAANLPIMHYENVTFSKRNNEVFLWIFKIRGKRTVFVRHTGLDINKPGHKILETAGSHRYKALDTCSKHSW